MGQILIVKKQLPSWVLPRQVVPCDKIVDLCNTSSLEHWHVRENFNSVSIIDCSRERQLKS